jgi:hypothetical protein
VSATEDIASAIWNEHDFFTLTSPAKLIYIWSWTNTRCQWCGIYQVPSLAIAFETGHSVDTVKSAIDELEAAEFVFYDGTWLWCKARVKRLNTRTAQMCKAVAKDLRNVPASHPYRVQLLDRYGGEVWQSRDTRTTIRAELGSLSGDTPMPPGSDPPFPRPSGIAQSHRGPTSVGPVTGTRTGSGTGPRRGWGAGKGNRQPEVAPSAAATAGVHARQEADAELAAQFPDVELAIVKHAVRRLTALGETATYAAIRTELDAA